MGKNRFDLRFVVERTDGFRSSPWRLWVTRRGDLYLSVRQMGGIQKYSFHLSGICRSAFTQEYGILPGMTDRATFKWRRALTPLSGHGGASRVALIAIPTSYLSRTAPPVPNTTVIDSAPMGGATYIEVGYTFESESFVVKAFQRNLRRLHSFTQLPTHESVFVCSYHSDWQDTDLKSPSGPGSVFPELLFSANDPQNTGRPIRMLFNPLPKDGDALIVQELGGFKVEESNGKVKGSVPFIPKT